ncbi:MAG: AcrR family transcriptional regulator [Halioglobus sp.]|jgi:AcrR family transcriptional regulator
MQDMTSVSRKVEVLEKNKPVQARAKRTYEAILVAAAQLLIEVGVERISTNLIAERAGIAVPALYRYFPNKYAVLHALGAAMMDRQNEVGLVWFKRLETLERPEALLETIEELLKLTYKVTSEQLAGLEIIQSLRAVGPLQELRLESNRSVSDQFAALIAAALGWPLTPMLKMQSRLSVETGYAVVELAMEDSTVSSDAVLSQGALMIQAYWRDVFQTQQKP